MPDAAPVTSAFGAMAPKAQVLLEEVAYARQAVFGGEPVLLSADGKSYCYRRALGHQTEAQIAMT
jgi:hypothetical protein